MSSIFPPSLNQEVHDLITSGAQRDQRDIDTWKSEVARLARDVESLTQETDLIRNEMIRTAALAKRTALECYQNAASDIRSIKRCTQRELHVADKQLRAAKRELFCAQQRLNTVPKIVRRANRKAALGIPARSKHSKRSKHASPSKPSPNLLSHVLSHALTFPGKARSPCKGNVAVTETAASAAQSFDLVRWAKNVAKFQRSRGRRGVTTELVLDAWERSGGRCYYTGIPLRPGYNTSLEHLTPVCMGGQDTAENLVFCDKSVNEWKGSMYSECFISVCRMVAQEWLRKLYGDDSIRVI